MAHGLDRISGGGKFRMAVHLSPLCLESQMRCWRVIRCFKRDTLTNSIRGH